MTMWGGEGYNNRKTQNMSGLRPAPNWNGYLYYSTGASQRLTSLTLPYRGRTGYTKPGVTWPDDTKEFVTEYSKYGKGGDTENAITTNTTFMGKEQSQGHMARPEGPG